MVPLLIYFLPITHYSHLTFFHSAPYTTTSALFPPLNSRPPPSLPSQLVPLPSFLLARATPYDAAAAPAERRPVSTLPSGVVTYFGYDDDGRPHAQARASVDHRRCVTGLSRSWTIDTYDPDGLTTR